MAALLLKGTLGADGVVTASASRPCIRSQLPGTVFSYFIYLYNLASDIPLHNSSLHLLASLSLIFQSHLNTARYLYCYHLYM